MTTDAERPNATKHTMWRALAHRNYRLFFVGQGISLVGTWMTRVATGWLVYRLSSGMDVAFLLGLVGFAGQVPSFLLAPVAGVIVDRADRHRVLVVTQMLSLVQSAGLAAVAFAGTTGPATIGVVVLLSIAQGLINAFDMPARQAFLVDMVARREDLPNAIALNSSLVNGGRLVGPAVAGVVIALVGEGWCFTVDAVSYVAVVVALLMMDVKPQEHPARTTHILEELVEGFRYTFGHPAIRSIILLLALVSFAGMPYTVFMPIFAGEILHGGPYALGFLTGASGVGALLGALYLARRPTVLGLGRVIVAATALFGGSLIAFANSTSLGLSMLLMVATGLGMMVQMAASNTILQTIVDEDKRGRVMSFYSMAFLGMVPFGSLFAGALGSWIGVPGTVTVGGVATLAGAAAFALQLPRLRALVRPTYVRLGILPQMASGVQSATELTTPPAQ